MPTSREIHVALTGARQTKRLCSLHGFLVFRVRQATKRVLGPFTDAREHIAKRWVFAGKFLSERC